MKNEKETREKLLISGKKEFLEKGYMPASLREICKNAGVTTGALYFFFKDKEDLFGSIVKEPLEKLCEIMKQHYEAELEEGAVSLEGDISKDKEAAIMVLDHMYEYYDIFILLLVKSQGSKYENYADEFVSITEKHYRILADRMCEVCGIEKLDDYTIHWFSHLQIYSFAQYITHGLSREEAGIQLEFLIKFLLSGWLGIFHK